MKGSEPISALDGLHSANIRWMYHWPGLWEALHDSDHSDGSQTLLNLRFELSQYADLLNHQREISPFRMHISFVSVSI